MCTSHILHMYTQSIHVEYLCYTYVYMCIYIYIHAYDFSVSVNWFRKNRIVTALSFVRAGSGSLSVHMWNI